MEKENVGWLKKEARILREKLLTSYYLDDIQIGLWTMTKQTNLDQVNLFALTLLENALRRGLTGNVLRDWLERAGRIRLVSKAEKSGR